MSESQRFQTARTQELLSSELSKTEREFVENIEEFGCQILTVDAAIKYHSWTYTLGLVDTGGRFELLTIGLPSSTASRALDDAAELLRNGVDLSQGRHHDLVGEVDVVFRFADPAWVKKLMGSAKWFNGSWDFLCCR